MHNYYLRLISVKFITTLKYTVLFCLRSLATIFIGEHLNYMWLEVMSAVKYVLWD